MSISFAAGQLLTAAQMNLLAPTYILKNSTQSVTNSATLVNDNDFSWTLLPGQTAIIEVRLQASTTFATGSTPGLKTAWTSSGTAGFAARMAMGPSDTIAGVTGPNEHQVQHRPLASGTGNLYALVGTNASYGIWETVIVSGGASGGTVTLQFAENAAAASTSANILVGSYGVLRYVA